MRLPTTIPPVSNRVNRNSNPLDVHLSPLTCAEDKEER